MFSFVGMAVKCIGELALQTLYFGDCKTSNIFSSVMFKSSAQAIRGAYTPKVDRLLRARITHLEITG
jgi:hypothetical protein